MTSVMISIQPKWVAKILSGEKTIEVRKTAPKLNTPFKCYIYETQGKTDTPWIDEEGHMIFRGRGQVVAEFVCDKISIFRPKSITCDHHVRKASCVSLKKLIEYANTKNEHIYAWKISNLVTYDKPKEVCEFFYPCEKQKYPYCFDCEHGLQKGEERPIDGMRHYDVPCGNWLKRPPQSWCYVEELR